MAQVPQISVLDGAGVSRDVATLTAIAALFGEVQDTPTSNTLLDRVKAVVTALTTIDGRVDGLETLVGTTNTTLTTIDGRVDGLEGLLTTQNGYLDGVETAIGTTNSTLTTINGNITDIEALITTLNGYVDGLETLIGTTNSTLTTIDGRVDGVETLIGTTNTTLSTINGNITDVETLLTTQNGYLDGVETAIASTNTLLTTQNGYLDQLEGYVDTLESLTSAMSAKLPAALGQTTMAASMSVALASNQSTVPVGQVSSAYDVSASFTRPANTTAYAANDINGASTAALTFSTVGPSAGSILITGADLEIDINAIPSGMTGFKLHLYSVTPPSAAADNAAMNVPSGDRASWLGCIDLDPPVDYGDTIGSKTTNINAQVKLAGTNLYGYLVTNGAYTPTSAAVHKITLHTMAV